MAEGNARTPLRFQVEDLGRVAKADITLKPLTLLVGENNSGKSYLATLIWVINKMREGPDRRSPGKPWMALCQAIGEELERAKSTRRAPDPSLVPEKIVGLAKSALPTLVIPRLRDVLRIDQLQVQLTFLDLSGDPWWGIGPPMGLVRVGTSAERARGDGPLPITILDQLPITILDQLRVGASEEVAGDLIATLLGGLTSAANETLLLPASRSGYLHLLPDVVDTLFQRQIGHGSDKILQRVQLTVVEFLRYMARPTTREDRRADLADLLERRVLQGRILGNSPATYAFEPQGSGLLLPPTQSSSVVTELLPLITVLRNGVPGVLIYEEPEAHLHPRVQRILAQVLVRLVRAGTTVVLTTHSDTMVQQFNNYLKLGALGEAGRQALAKETGEDIYTDQDALQPEDVGAYEFRFREDGRTDVASLDVRPDGVVMPLFNQELDSLLREVLILNRLMEAQ